MVLPNPAGIERSEPFCDCGGGAYSRRRSHIAKRLLIACRESDLRSNLTALPANQLLTTDRQTTTPRTNHFVLPTLSFKATDFLTIPTDFFFSAYGVIRTNHTAPDSPDFRIFAAPPRFSRTILPDKGVRYPFQKRFKDIVTPIQFRLNTNAIS